MERNFKHISDELKLPQESRERIRSQLASYQKQSEVIPMKRTLKSRVPLIVAAVVMAMALTLTAAATVTHLFRNAIIVSSVDDIPAPSSENGAPVGVAVGYPSGDPPIPLDKIAETARYKSDHWVYEDMIDGGDLEAYSQWDLAEVLSNDPALRSRRFVGREDGAEKMEYTAENPANLIGTLTGRVMFDLSWMDSQYNNVPDANNSFVVNASDGSYVCEAFSAVYAKPDDSGYVLVDISYTVLENCIQQTYIVDGSFETAYHYTSADGCEFLILMHDGWVRVECNTDHANIKLYGAYLTADEVEDILDNLSLSIAE